MEPPIQEMCRQYAKAKKLAADLQAENDAAVKASRGESGTGHHTPVAVIQAVMEKKYFAEKIAEHICKLWGIE